MAKDKSVKNYSDTQAKYKGIVYTKEDVYCKYNKLDPDIYFYSKYRGHPYSIARNMYAYYLSKKGFNEADIAVITDTDRGTVYNRVYRGGTYFRNLDQRGIRMLTRFPGINKLLK